MMKQSSSIAANIKREHADLREVMDQIATDFKTEPTRADFMSWKLDVTPRLRDFHRKLSKHFDLEEKGGFMVDVIATTPQHTRKVDAFEHEHVEIVDRLTAITADLTVMSEHTMSGLADLRARTRGVLEALHKHEAGERALFQRAYFQDIGGGD